MANPKEKDAVISDLTKKLSDIKEEALRYKKLANGIVDFSDYKNNNVNNWKNLQEKGYFENHPNHSGLADFDSGEIEAISRFFELSRTQTVVVIGCGYGRDVARIAPLVDHVYGIDVSETILGKARTFLAGKGINNFTPVLVDNYVDEIPNDVDLVFCFVVFQHLTRKLTKEYLENLGAKLNVNGLFVGQFLETMVEDETLLDARLEDYEPSVSWSVMQLHRLGAMTGLETVRIETNPVSNGAALWHWACFRRKR